VIRGSIGRAAGSPTGGRPTQAAGRPTTVLEIRHADRGRDARTAADEDLPQPAAPGQKFAHPLIAFAIEHSGDRAGIAQGIIQLARRPPGVERGHHRPRQRRAVKGDGPFRQVAHRQGDPFPGLHAARDQQPGKGHCGAGEGVEADPLVLVHQEGHIAERLSQPEDIGQRFWTVLPGPHRAPVDFERLHLEHRAGRTEQRIGLRQRNGRPGRLTGSHRSRKCAPAAASISSSAAGLKSSPPVAWKDRIRARIALAPIVSA
jgi:hypothetical protein